MMKMKFSWVKNHTNMEMTSDISDQSGPVIREQYDKSLWIIRR
jgi:hypothetical protein